LDQPHNPKADEPDGYTLKIRCGWDGGERSDRELEFGLALANDRLFVKVTHSNLEEADAIPRMAYLPPFAGITSREARLTGAIRRRRIGEGLAGAVLRNLVLDMYTDNLKERARLREGRSKISDADLKRLRAGDPWERLQAALRETFSAELDVAPFNEEYHSYIQVDVVKGYVMPFKIKRFHDYRVRDLMVEGSGFLQWLSVYTLALNPSINVLLLDEPDAHLHTTLQDHLLGTLRVLADQGGKQALVATHSSEILRHSDPGRIYQVRRGGQGSGYLKTEQHKVGLLAGLGSDYAPKVDRVFNALKEEVPELACVSLCDRDDEHINTVGPRLEDKSVSADADFHCRKWRRRHIESYLIWPPAIAAAASMSQDDVEARLRDVFGIAVAHETFTRSEAPEALLNIRGKYVLKEGDEAILGQLSASALDVAHAMDPDVIPDHIKMLLDDLVRLA
jgi:AAA domain, putative AbiEii toxin, Type IV TA system